MLCLPSTNWTFFTYLNLSTFFFYDELQNCTENGTLVLSQDDGPIQYLVTRPLNWYSLLLCPFPVFAIIGNMLVVMSVYRERNLHNITNYFIVSLAVADLMVALLVMPLAVYVTLKSGFWNLGDIVCDVWVAFDVMFSTASIVHLAAISYDRYIAVIQPIRYAKQSKETRRVYITISFCWLVSFAIALPIVFGTNYFENWRDRNDCVFYNAEYIIFSSIGSFLIPCIVTVLLYCRIMYAIHKRAKRQAFTDIQRQAMEMANSALTSIATIAMPQTANHHQKKREEQEKNNGNPPNHETEASNHLKPDKLSPKPSIASEEDLEYADDLPSTSRETQIEEEALQRSVRFDENEEEEGTTEKTHKCFDFCRSGSLRFNFTAEDSLDSWANSSSDQTKKRSRKLKTTTRRMFGRMTMKKKRRQAQRQERKATKTLAIVLAVFLICWIPFFSANNTKAVCMIAYGRDFFDQSCNVNIVVMVTFVWLGYINSIMNPIIYTIFNPDFRRAFYKIVCRQ